MEPSSCKFSWRNYIDYVHHKLHNMMKESDLTDVTIVSDDKKHFNAHKIVLKACSSVFQNIIEDLPQTNSVIYLRGIQYQEIESILEYMYLGEVTISQQRVYEFLKVAADLEVQNFDRENTDPTSIVNDTSEPMHDMYEASNSKAEHNDDFIFGNTIPSTENRNEKLEESDSANVDIDMDVSNNANMKSHEVGDMKLAYKCNQCDFKAPHKFIMKKHIKVNHADLKVIGNMEKEFPCNQCELKCSNQSNLTRHIQSQHGEKAFCCDQCEKQFKRKDSLKEHIQAAHDKIELVCKICNFTTSYRQDLKRHMKIRHSMSISINAGN